MRAFCVFFSPTDRPITHIVFSNIAESAENRAQLAAGGSETLDLRGEVSHLTRLNR